MVVTVITTPPPPKPLIYLSHIYLLSAIYVPGGLDGKESACNAEDLGLILGLGRSLGEGNGNPLQYSLPGKFHGQRSLVGHSPWGCKELGLTEN